MTTRTHHAQVMYLARCLTCNWTEEHLHADEAAEAVGDHNAAHEIRHTCRYQEHGVGWVGRDACRACRVEDERTGRANERRRSA